MQRVLKIFAIAALAWLLLIPSCKRDEVSNFDLVSIKAGSVDLATAPQDVGVSTSILATFTDDIDPGSVTISSVLMTREYDSTRVGLTIIIAKRTLSIRPATDLTPGTHFTLTIDASLRSSHGSNFRSFSGGFKTIGLFVPPGEKAYWDFEDTYDDIVGTYDPSSSNDVVEVNFVERTGVSSLKAAAFNGTTSLIEISKGSSLLTSEMTISFWMFLNSDNHTDSIGNPKGSYVLGIGNGHGLEFDVDANFDWCRFGHGLLLNDGKLATSDFQYYANGRTHSDLSGEPDSVKFGIDNATTVNVDLGTGGLRSKLDKAWAHIAFSYNDSTKTRSLYINGDLMYRQDFNLLDSTVLPVFWPLMEAKGLKFVAQDPNLPVTYDDILAFGFWQSSASKFGAPLQGYSNTNSNHFQGQLDDIRIFNRALSDREILMMYQDEK